METTLRRQAKIYATSAAAGLAEAGVLEEGAEVPGAGVTGTSIEGVGAGRIRDTRLGVYSFAFLKNSFIFVRGQA
jgi:hypothetical protein